MSLGAEFALTKPGTLSEGTTAFHDEPRELRHTRGGLVTWLGVSLNCKPR